MADLDVALRLRLLNELSRPAKAAGNDLRGLRDAARSLDGARGGERLARNVGRAGDAARTAQGRVRGVRTEAEALGRTQGGAALARDLGRAADVSGRARRGVGEVVAQVGRLGRASVGRSVPDGLDAITRKADAAASALGRVRQGMRDKLQAVGGGGEADRGSLNMALPLGAIAPALGAAGAVKAAKDTFGAAISIEKSLAEVRKFYDLDDTGLAAMKREIFDMVGELGKAPEAIASVYARAGQQGVPRDQVREYARDVTKIAVAWEVGEEAAANGLGTLKSALGINQAELVKLAGVINTLADGMEGPVAESDLLEYLARVAGTSKALKGSAKAAAAMGAALRSAGDQPEIAATTYNTILTKLASADRGSKDALAGYEELGFDPKKLAADMNTNADATILAFFERVRALQAEGKNVVGPLGDMFGTEYSDNILKVANALETYKKALALVENDEAGVKGLDRAYKIQSGTTDAQLDRFKANMKLTADAMAAEYLPSVNAGLERMNTLLGEIRERGSLFKDLEAGAQGFAKGLGFETVGAIYDDLGRRIKALIQPETSGENRYAQMFEGARAAGETFRQELESIRDLYVSLPTMLTGYSKEEQSAAAAKVNRAFDDTTVQMERNTPSGMVNPEAAARRWAMGDERYAAARRRDAEALNLSRRQSLDAMFPGQARLPAATPVGPATTPVADAPKSHLSPDALSALRAAFEGRGKAPAAAAAAPIAAADGAAIGRAAGPEIRRAIEAAKPEGKVDTPAASVPTPPSPAAGAAAKPAPIAFPEPKIDPSVKGRIEAAYGADLGPVGQTAMAAYNAALTAGGAQAVAQAQAIAGQLKAALSFTATPTISPRFTGGSPVAPGGASPGAAPSAPAAGGAAPAPGKQSRLNRSGETKVAAGGDTFNIYGATDARAVARQVQRHQTRRQNSEIRMAKSRALHDLGSPTA